MNTNTQLLDVGQGQAFWGQGCYVEEKTQAIASPAVMTHDYHNMFSVALLTTMRYYGTQEETFAGGRNIHEAALFLVCPVLEQTVTHSPDIPTISHDIHELLSQMHRVDLV